MPYCPICRTEYRSGFTRCTDCGETLVQVLPELTVPEAQRYDHELQLIKLVEFLTPMEAEMVRELLEANGIPALVRGRSDPLGVVSGAQPIALMVAEQHLKRATEIYEAFFDRHREETAESAEEE